MGNCFEGVAGNQKERRPVGLERKYLRELRRLERLEAQWAAQSTPKERAERCATPKERAERCARHNFRRVALVSPAHRRFTEDFEMTDTSLGAGMSGDVMLAMPRTGPGGATAGASGCVAVKILDKTSMNRRQLRQLWREVDIYLDMDHAHIAQLLQVYDEQDKVYLVMEYCSGETLANKLARKGFYSERETAIVLQQVLHAVRYCHDRPGGAVCHRDLKPQNMLYASKAEDAPIKLVDFGLSCVVKPSQPLPKDRPGTLGFAAPEILRGCGHDNSSDMWSVGVIAYNLLSGELPFDGEDSSTIARATVDCRLDMSGRAWLHVSEAARDFVASLVRSRPGSRLTASGALHHPWLSEAVGAVHASPIDSTPVVGVPCALRRPPKEVLQSLCDFASQSAARRACCALAVYADASPEGRDTAEEHFCVLDADRNGAISLAELTIALQEGLGISPERSRWIFERLDLNGENRIEWSEFLAAVVGARLLCRKGAVQKAFNCFDVDGSGDISPGEFAALLGPHFCGEAVPEILGNLFESADSAVGLKEFSAVVALVEPTDQVEEEQEEETVPILAELTAPEDSS